VLVASAVAIGCVYLPTDAWAGKGETGRVTSSVVGMNQRAGATPGTILMAQAPSSVDFNSVRQQLNDQEPGVGQKAEAILVRALTDPDAGVRKQAATALGDSEDLGAVGHLIGALKDPNAWVGEAVANSLGKSKNPNVVDRLIVTLKNANEKVRNRSALALGQLRDPRSVEPLTRALTDQDWVVRKSAAEALGNIGDPSSVTPLIGALKDSDEVRQAAASGLGKMRDPRAVEPLIEALKSWNEGVKRVAAGALGNLNDSRALAFLIETLKNPLIQERRLAAEGLGNARDHRAVEALVGALADPDAEVRRRAAWALRDAKDPRATARLVGALRDWHAKSSAASALSEQAWTPATEIDKTHLLAAQKNWYELRQAWGATAQVLYEDLQSKEFHVVENAICTLIGIGKEECIEELVRRLPLIDSKEVAEVYLNCGNSRLKVAAEEWAKERGYQIFQREGGTAVTWGQY